MPETAPSASVRPRRSALYMPASNARAVDKARSLPCDVVILDLEDSVGPDLKAQARKQAVEAVQAGGFGSRGLAVRVNGLDTPWGRDDLLALQGLHLDAIVAPKVSSAAEVHAYDALILGEMSLWTMVESCAALFQLDAMGACAATTRLSAWIIGPNDLAREMRCRLDETRAPLLPALALAVAAARAHGLSIWDGVFNAIDDDAGFERQCIQGRDFGFDGKTLIHPRQIEIANRAFGPSSDELDWSRRILAAFDAPENSGQGALRVDGRMVERLHLDEARHLLAMERAILGAA
ncbi:CoA ester lyase [soil metagenome]